MKVSVITIAYNAAETIRDTIESVLSQDYPDVEYIIVDGNSSDGTQEIVKSYGDQISKFISEPDGGVYDAMNKGIALASGDIVSILNSDDAYANDRVISDVVEKLVADGSDIIYGDLQYVDRADTSKVLRTWKSGVLKPNSFKWGWMPPHPTVFVRRKCYEDWGGFNLKLKTSADYELMLRFLHKHRVVASYLPKVLVKMKMGGQSNASVGNRLYANKEDRMAWKLNGLKPYFFTIWLKPIRKIGQFFDKG